ncbi:unnamed protein product [Acanthoscelides obtectus]|uniref:MADF domain-containing protein n=1 Tax=Acanthoscelides obtectus TaxID=200917 RepID=A0A9P0K4Z9_ACAOB|nr:unnamed protein product [Acanthoscelides obtectus]CAK1666458.1 hypothetical protein AOBTE_LOCUS25339 [Acanthoscelides obtectus]
MAEKLIELVQQHEVLYNHSLLEYRDQNVRQQAWEEIGRHLRITADNAKSTWDRLRRCFCNARSRRMSAKSLHTNRKTPPWKFEHHMEFLLPYVEVRRSRGNSHLQNSQIEYEIRVPQALINNDDYDLGKQEDQESVADDDGAAFERDDEQFTETQTSLQDRVSNVENANNSYYRKRKIEETETAQNKHTSFENMDETDLFFLGLSRMVKNCRKWNKLLLSWQ